MNRWASCFLLAVFVAGIAWAAVAQQIENTPETLVFSVEGRANYEDNRDATERNKEEMLSLWLTPGARLTADDGLTSAFLSYRPSLGWRDNPRDDQNDTELYHALEANIRHTASTRLVLGGLNKFEMTDDPQVTQGGVTVRENASYWFNQTKAWMIYGLTERGQMEMEGSYLIKRYDKSNFSELGDEDRLLLNGTYRYRLEPDFHAFTFVGYDRPTFQSGVRGDYQGYLGGVGLDRVFNDQWQGTLSAGYKVLDYQDAEEDDAGMPYLMAATVIKPLARLIVDASAEYSLEPSDRSLYSSKEYLRMLLRGTVIVSEGLSAYGQLVYANGAYDAKTQIAGEQIVSDQVVVNGDDTLMDYQIGLNVRPQASRYSGRISYEYEDWDSDVRESFTRNTVSVAVTMDF